MTIIDIEDTVRFHRLVGEEPTRIVPVYANKDVPRRSAVSGKVHTPRTAFAFVGSTREQPIIGAPYVGLHRAPEPAPAEVAPPPVVAPGLFARLFARLGRIGG